MIKNLLRVSRFNFLPASLLPYALGSALALRTFPFRSGRFFLGVIGTALVHLAANLLNEYWDFRLGADRREDDYQPHFGGSKSLPAGLVSPAAVRQAAWLCLTGALLIGFGLVFILKSPILLFLVAGGVFIAWGYTAPPLSLAYRGWGELVLFIAFGPLLVLGGYYLQSVNFSGAAAVLSLAPGFLIAALLMANEIADAGDDARAGKKNLAVRWGPSRAGVLIAVGIGGAYAVVVLGGLSGLFPATFLLILFTIFWAERALRSLRTAVRAGGGFRLSSARMIVFYNIFIIAMIIIILIS